MALLTEHSNRQLVAMLGAHGQLRCGEVQEECDAAHIVLEGAASE